MPGQAGFFDTDDRLRWLSAAGDPLERLRALVDFEAFRAELKAAVPRADRSRGGRLPYAPVLMFRILVLQALCTLSDEHAEYQLRDRLNKEEKATLREGATPAGWSKARTRQIDRDGRWTIRRGRKARPPEGAARQAGAEIAVPMFGYKNHVNIDRRHGVRAVPEPAASPSPMRRDMMAASAARCSTRPTPPAASGPTRPTAARPTSTCSSGAA